MIRKLLAPLIVALAVILGAQHAAAAIPPVRTNWSAAKYLKGTNCLIRVKQTMSRSVTVRAENSSCRLITITAYSYQNHQITGTLKAPIGYTFIPMGWSYTVYLPAYDDACYAWIRGYDLVGLFGDLVWYRSTHILA